VRMVACRRTTCSSSNRRSRFATSPDPPSYRGCLLDKGAPWQPVAWSARVEKNEACLRAPLTLRGGFGVIGMSGGNVKPTTSSGLHPQKSFIW
jgi:hypothetical protein